MLTGVLEAEKESSQKAVQDGKAAQIQQLMGLRPMSTDEEEKAMFTAMIKSAGASFVASASGSKRSDDQEAPSSTESTAGAAPSSQGQSSQSSQ